MLFLLAACWSPDPDLGAPTLAPLEPLEEEAPAEPDGAEADPAPEDGVADAPPADEDPEDPPFLAYDGTLLTAPVTLVDDVGTPVTVLQRAGIALKVIDEEPIRKRVICEACQPAAEGWLQTQVVSGRP